MVPVTDGAVLLEAMGFETVPTDLPGEWATDGEWTVAIQTRPVHGGPLDDVCHQVFVYATPASNVGIDSALAGQATTTSVESALRAALSRADYPLSGAVTR